MTSQVALVALLLVAGCNSGTRDPAGAGGTGGSGGAGGAAGSESPNACPGILNGSCRQTNGSSCYEYGGLAAAEVGPVASGCGGDSFGMWTAGSACNRSGALGGCREVEGTKCVVLWKYEGTAADAMSDCADRDGTWITP